MNAIATAGAAAGNAPALRVDGLSKRYAPGFTLEDVTFDLPAGYIMGLIGPNGAGKSTLIRLILTMTRRDAGSIEVFGLDAVRDEEAVKLLIGTVFDENCFDERMSPERVERLMAPLYPAWDHGRFTECLHRFGLDPTARIRTFSRGMRMKLMLAVALSHDAKLLILDEPTAGLDVLARDELMDILADYIADGTRSVLFSTHITADLERSADFITYINGGRLYYTGPKDEFEDAFRLVQGGPAELDAALSAAAVGVRRYGTGFDALVRVEDVAAITAAHPGLAVRPVDIDDIMRLTNADGAKLKGTES